MAAPEIMTPEEVAEYLRLSPATVYRLIRDNKLAAARVGRRYRIARKSVERLLLANSTDPRIREAIFAEVAAVADRNASVPAEDIQREVDAAVARARGEA